MCSLHCQPGQGTWGQEGRKEPRGGVAATGVLLAGQVTRMSLGNQDCNKQKRLLFFQYADPVTDLLDRCGVFRARLFRESCVFHQGCYVKDLSRLGRDLRKTLILDNSPASYIFHPENAVSGPDTPTLHGLGEFLPRWEREWAGELWALPGGRTAPSGPHQPAGALEPGEEELAGGLCCLSAPPQVPVQSWFDDMADTELLNLIPIFEELSGAEDVYTSLGQLRAP